MTHMMPTTLPTDFRDVFIRDGWRGIERYFGARTSLMMHWIELSGGLAQLQAERREFRRAQFEAAKAALAPQHRRVA